MICRSSEPPMQPTQELIDQLRRDKIESARKMSPEQKLLTGPELFDLAVESVRTGIRMQHPGADDAAVEQLLRARLRLLHRRDQL